jgi:hypothetical protein
MCSCAVEIEAKCVTVVGDFTCSSIETGLPLSQFLEELDTFICVKFNEVLNYLTLVSVGSGAKVYAGTDGIGRKKIRSLVSEDNSVTIEESENQINFIVTPADGSETKLNPGTNVTITGLGTTASPYIVNSSFTDTNTIADGSETKLNPGTNVTVTGLGTTASPYIVNAADGSTPDGSETKLNPGTNVTITGSGTTASPYIVNSSFTDTNTIADGSETKLNPGTNVTITGSGTTASPYIVNSSFTDTNTIADGSETKFESTTATTVSGIGTIASPYTVESVNLQKIITASLTLTNSDKGYVVFINNGANAITITVPSGLVSNFEVGFIQQGTGDVTFVSSGTTLKNPIGFLLKGQDYAVMLEKVQTTEVFYLTGNTKV